MQQDLFNIDKEDTVTEPIAPKRKNWFQRAWDVITWAYPSVEQVQIFMTPGATNFKKLLGGNQPNPPLVSKWWAIIAYPFIVIILTMSYLSFALILLFLIAEIHGEGSSRSRKYPRERYRKIVKEGILWNTTYYVERDKN